MADRRPAANRTLKQLGRELRAAREAKALSLRAVEAKTGISNAFLSQLENGLGGNPSPKILQRLAELYEIGYEHLMRLTGYLDGTPETAIRDIFISHRSSDKDFVRELVARLEDQQIGDRKIAVWLDEAEVRPGASLPAMINDGLEKSRFFGIVMTPEYFRSESGWTDAEWHSALHGDPDNRRGRLIPLLVENCPYVPYLLRHLKAIDFRRQNYEHALQELLSVLRDEPLPRPVSHRGQLIASGTRIDRSTLVAERAVPDADPDAVTETLYCNLLPIERLPRYVYIAPIADRLMGTDKQGRSKAPTKSRLKEEIRAIQDEFGGESEHRFMPSFRVFESQIVTLHDLEDSENPLNAIIDDSQIATLDVPAFTRDDDLRRLLISLLNMSLDRHLFRRAGLTIDETKSGRYFFPAKDGKENSVTWVPRKKKASRTVAKPIVKDGRILYWRHLGAYLRIVFLVNKFYLEIEPTWVITKDGIEPSGGPEISKRVMKWTGPERNLQVLYHVRFWTTVLRARSGGGPISIRTGDQSLEVATVPAMIQLGYGISDDQRDLMRLLDEEAMLLAAEEEELADIALDEIEEGDTDELIEDEFALEENNENPSGE